MGPIVSPFTEKFSKQLIVEKAIQETSTKNRKQKAIPGELPNYHII